MSHSSSSPQHTTTTIPSSYQTRQVPGLPGAQLVWVPRPQTRLSRLHQIVGHASGKDTGAQGLWIWQTPLTRHQYATLMGHLPDASFSAHPDAPVDRISWLEALACCNALSRRFQLSECYTSHPDERDLVAALQPAYRDGDAYERARSFRLPTEDEWEAFTCQLFRDAPSESNALVPPWMPRPPKHQRPFAHHDSDDEIVPPRQAHWALSPHGDVHEWCFGGRGAKRCMRGFAWTSSNTHPAPAFSSMIEGYHRLRQVGFRPVLSL